ncbi:MAG TPA: hypothetical protein VKU38_20045 [Ktedonobacteraceae bacterium]|nr:hypothetical protein [Ktedonobacteraceae bacterium]
MADWHIAAARALGALNRAPTRLRAQVWPHARRRVGACFSTPNETSEAMSSSYYPFHWSICINPSAFVHPVILWEDARTG